MMMKFDRAMYLLFFLFIPLEVESINQTVKKKKKKNRYDMFLFLFVF